MPAIANREVFYRDPSTTVIPNDGVAKVVEPETPQQWDVLRFELQSFVCDGEYLRGLERVLSSFLDNMSHAQQPAVWVSGFFGSGKSHFVRVLEYLWRDIQFPDGARARSLASLPHDITALLVELSRLGRQEGGLRSAAGTLGASAGAVRLGLLAILFRSARLPEQYPAARFVVWLQQNGWLDAAKASVRDQGKSFERELRNLYVSPYIAQALLDTIPGIAASPADVRALLRTQYPVVSDISDDELRSTMQDVLALQSATPGKLPLTLLSFDELQQFIAEDPVRTLQVQNAVEACSSHFGSRLLFVGTGQSSLQETPQLQKLQGRFSVRVTLSDTDVEKVVREVVLRKRPDKVGALKIVLDAASGEIDRHLAGTKIGSRAADVQDRVADYPLLPVRRRFWERVLRAVDAPGTAGQLRTQLRLVHDTARDVANEPLGTVVPADAIYWQQETEMQQTGVLQRDLATTIRELRQDGPDGLLRARLCALIFLINKLPTDGPLATGVRNKLPTDGPLATGVRATAETLADLLVEDLTAGSAALRQRVPGALQALLDSATLMKVDDEYRLQTRESAEWDNDFRSRYARILNDDSRLANDRVTAIKSAVAQALKGITLTHGASKTTRKFDLYYGPNAPSLDTGNVPVWVRDEWSVPERTVIEDARAAGVDSPIVFVFPPRVEADELRRALARAGAADETVKTRPTPQTDAGKEAKAAMESRAKAETEKVAGLIDAVVKNARVYQGGGTEIAGDTFAQHVRQAVEAAIERLYPKYSLADYAGWDKVVARARDGAADALTALGYAAEVEKHPVCQEVRAYVGAAGRKGSDVRRRLEGAPYGWRRDAVDGALLALLAAGFVRASRNGQPAQPKELNQTIIGVTDFFSEGVTISALQRMDVRSLASSMGLPVKPGEEMAAVPVVLSRLADLAQAAGGDPPLPGRPDDSLVKRLRASSGNQQFVDVHAHKDELLAAYKAWSAAADAVGQRVPAWQRLLDLLHHAQGLPVVAAVEPQVTALRANRSLLDNPDPVPPLLSQVGAAVRAAVNDAHQRLCYVRNGEVAALEASEEWKRLSSADRQRLLDTNGLGAVPPLDVGTDAALLTSLNGTPLSSWEDRIIALPAHTAKAREEAVRILTPTAVTYRPPTATLRSADEVEAYVKKLRGALLERVSPETPVVIV